MREYSTAKKGAGWRNAPGPTPDLNDFVRALRSLADTYRPELHYMRGPGPKWHAKHGSADRSWTVEQPAEKLFARTLRDPFAQMRVGQAWRPPGDVIKETKEKLR